MSRLTDIAQAMSAKHGMTQREAEKFLTLMVDVMNGALHADKQLKVKGLGTFKVTSVNARESVDVNTGERIVIDGRDKISFTPEASMRDLVNKPFAQFETTVVNDGVDFDAIDRKYLQKDETEPVADHVVQEEKPSVETAEPPAVQDNPEPSSAEPVGGEYIEEKTVKTDSNMTEQKKGVKSEVYDEYGYPVELQDDIQELSDRLDGKTRQVRILTACMACLLALCLFGSWYLYRSIKERDRRIEHLVAQIQEDQQQKVIHETGVRPDGGVNLKAEKPRMSVRNETDHLLEKYNRKVTEMQVQQEADAYRHEVAVKKAEEARAKEDARVDPARRQKDENTRKAEEARLREVEKRAEELRKTVRQSQQQQAKTAAPPASTPPTAKPSAPAKPSTAAKPSAPAAKTPASAPTDQTAYNQDPRVRLGAYVITGIAQTVTVREGQTLAGISKAYLGPGMECYVEAVNGGIKEVKTGQKLKIPAVKIKKSAKK